MIIKKNAVTGITSGKIGIYKKKSHACLSLPLNDIIDIKRRTKLKRVIIVSSWKIKTKQYCSKSKERQGKSLIKITYFRYERCTCSSNFEDQMSLRNKLWWLKSYYWIKIYIHWKYNDYDWIENKIDWTHNNNTTEWKKNFVETIITLIGLKKNFVETISILIEWKKTSLKQ